MINITNPAWVNMKLVKLSMKVSVTTVFLPRHSIFMSCGLTKLQGTWLMRLKAKKQKKAMKPKLILNCRVRLRDWVILFFKEPLMGIILRAL